VQRTTLFIRFGNRTGGIRRHLQYPGILQTPNVSQMNIILVTHSEDQLLPDTAARQTSSAVVVS